MDADLPPYVRLWRGNVLVHDALRLLDVKLWQLHKLRGIHIREDALTRERYGTGVVRIWNRELLVESLHNLLVAEAVDLVRKA
jgi:hypothetical protein